MRARSGRRGLTRVMGDDGPHPVPRLAAPRLAVPFVTPSPASRAPRRTVCSEIKKDAVGKKLKVAGPVRLPTKTLTLVVRKSPCGNGTKTFDRYELKIHKRIIDLHSPTEVIKQITAVSIEPGVDVEVAISQ